MLSISLSKSKTLNHDLSSHLKKKEKENILLVDKLKKCEQSSIDAIRLAT